MTQDDVIRLAREAGLCCSSNGFIDWIDAGPSLHEMTLFAKLIAEKEREACAKICEEKYKAWKKSGLWEHSFEYKECAEAIRERGQT